MAERYSDRRRGRGRGALMLLVIILTLVVALVVGIAIIGANSDEEDEPGSIDSTTIKNSFLPLAELAVEEYRFTNVGEFNKDRRKVLGWGVPGTGNHFLVTYDGSVKAGVRDIEQVSIEVDDVAQAVTVSVPAVEVIDFKIDPGSVDSKQESRNPLNQLQVEDVTFFLDEEQKKGRDIAVELGLLDRAEARAEELFVSHVDNVTAGYTSEDYAVEINWR